MWDHSPLSIKVADDELEPQLILGLGRWWPYFRRALDNEVPDVYVMKWDGYGATLGLTSLRDKDCVARRAIIFSTEDPRVFFHEMGHALALGHETSKENVMYKYIAWSADGLSAQQRRWLREHYHDLYVKWTESILPPIPPKP